MYNLQGLIGEMVIVQCFRDLAESVNCKRPILLVAPASLSLCNLSCRASAIISHCCRKYGGKPNACNHRLLGFGVVPIRSWQEFHASAEAAHVSRTAADSCSCARQQPANRPPKNCPRRHQFRILCRASSENLVKATLCAGCVSRESRITNIYRGPRAASANARGSVRRSGTDRAAGGKKETR